MLRRLVRFLIYLRLRLRLMVCDDDVVRKAILGVLAGNRFSGITNNAHAHLPLHHQQLAKDIQDYKENSEREEIEEVRSRMRLLF